MGETLDLFRAEFNGSVRVESRDERLSCESGAVVLREVLERLRMREWFEARLRDPRSPVLITHPFIELVTTMVLLYGLGWRDQDDADELRDDAVLRLAVSTRRGVSALKKRPREEGEVPHRNPPHPDGLASQPTLSRMMGTLASDDNRAVLRASLLEVASRRIRSQRRGHRPRYITIDVDSLPIEVHGHQPHSAYNGYYHANVYHPLVASVAEYGDLLDAKLRKGNAHTAEGALGFVSALIEQVEEKLCQVASVRFDAGFPEEELLAGLEQRSTPYVARVRNNKVLDRMAQPYLKRPPGRPPKQPRTWLYEMTYRAQSWSRERRVVLVVLERADELFLHHFWLITSWSAEQMDGQALLQLYRQRGTAEGHFGELVNVLAPALSSVPRPKRHYRNRPPTKRTLSGDSFAINEVVLLLNALAYNVAHVARRLLQPGWSLRRFRERILRTAARVQVKSRRAILIISADAARYWQALLHALNKLRLQT
jgi:Transposase DDE domain group 1